MHEEHRANPENTRRRKQRKNKKENNQQINYKRERELRKEWRESLVMNPMPETYQKESH